MNQRIKLMAAYRLRARASPLAKGLIKVVDDILSRHGIKTDPTSSPYPRKYTKQAPEAMFDTLKKDFEAEGFKFSKSALHKMNTKAVESDGVYQSVSYILDLVYLDGRVIVELHH